MEVSFIESTTLFEPLLNEIDNEDSDDTEEKSGATVKNKRRDSSLARRKIEDYLEMKKLKQQTYDFFYDDAFLDNG